MSLSQMYTAHLRDAATHYVCVLCKQKSPIDSRQAFRDHLSLHSDEIDRLRRDPAFDLTLWIESVENQSKVVGKSPAGHDRGSSTLSASDNASTPADQLNRLSLDAKRKMDTRQLQPAVSPPRPPSKPGGERPRSVDNNQSRSTKGLGRSEKNVRKAAPRSSHETPAPFHGNWAGGQPTRTLFNPADGSNVATTSQVTLPSRSAPQQAFSAAPSSDFTRQTSQRGAAQFTPTSSTTGNNSERGILPMPSAQVTSPHSRDRGTIAMPRDARWPDMLLQPDSRPISQEQLAAEVKSIYAGLTMVESKCIHVDKAQAAAIRDAGPGEAKISHEHWQALIALHRTLLHEHHDFFLASQHPSASPALRRLASKYSMPARMWKHGIHSFLELLRYRLPDSLEFMISFIYTAYQMMSLLYETVPAFENTWIECLGDLGRYRMAIEDEDIRDRENWANVARFWYTKAADRSPDVGRLYHHLAILARPNALQQLSLYSRSLISVQIFNSARESILTLFNPLLGRSEASSSQISQIDTHFIKAHALLFNKEQPKVFMECQNSFLAVLDSHIGRVTAKWREQGAFIAISSIASLFDYGTSAPLRRVFDLGSYKVEQASRASTRFPAFDPQRHADAPSEDSDMEHLVSLDEMDSLSRENFDLALTFAFATATLVLKRKGDKNILPFVHILLCFLLSLGNIRSLDARIETSYVVGAILKATPIKELCSYLNTLTRSDQSVPRYEVEEFIRPEKEDPLPLPEDNLMRGQVWCQDYFPSDWWKNSGGDEEEKNIEHASTVRVRIDRVKWLAYRLSFMDIGLHYSPGTRLWSWWSAEEHIDVMPGLSHSPVIETPFSHYLDVDMQDVHASQVVVDGDSTYDSGDDSPEMKALNNGNHGQAAQSADSERLGVPTANFNEAHSIMNNGVTFMVFDEQLMLYNPELFQLLVTRRFTIILPHTAFHEISSLSKSTEPNAGAAKEALQQMQVAYKTTDIRILNAKGVDITKQHLLGEQATVEQSPCETQGVEDIQDDLIGVVRRATDLSTHEKPVVENQVRRAILLTEDRRTRLHAAGQKVAALAPSVLKKVLESNAQGFLTRVRSFSRGSGRTPQDRSPVTEPATPADVAMKDRMDTE